MNCFNHPDKPAIGFCKSCCKGLCADCAATLPNGLACRNACEDRVTLINQIIDNNQKVISAANVQVRSSGLFILLLGAVFCLFGFLPLFMSGNTGTLFLGIIGLFFAAYGVIRLLKKSQYYPTAK
ncbi:MAG: hypothetical protein FJ224_09605 [Lentisphaerae bacterium]|nr:hypothetical protein [Lentisphaerota bacterium]